MSSSSSGPGFDSRREERVTAASYVINFYNEIENLTQSHAQYLNLLAELAREYSGNMDKLTEEHKRNVALTTQTLRHYVFKTYIMYQTITTTMNKPEDAKVKGIYKKIKDEYIIKAEDSEDYTVIMHKVLADEVMKGLLQTSQDLVNNVLD